jgi:hypothetical protein
LERTGWSADTSTGKMSAPEPGWGCAKSASAKTGPARAAEVSSTKAAATKAPSTEVTTAAATEVTTTAATTTTTAAAASPYRLTKSNKTGDYQAK